MEGGGEGQECGGGLRPALPVRNWPLLLTEVPPTAVGFDRRSKRSVPGRRSRKQDKRRAECLLTLRPIWRREQQIRVAASCFPCGWRHTRGWILEMGHTQEAQWSTRRPLHVHVMSMVHQMTYGYPLDEVRYSRGGGAVEKKNEVRSA